MTYNDLDIPNNVKVALDSIVDWATTGDNTKGFKEYALLSKEFVCKFPIY